MANQTAQLAETAALAYFTGGASLAATGAGGMGGYGGLLSSGGSSPIPSNSTTGTITFGAVNAPNNKVLYVIAGVLVVGIIAFVRRK